MLDNAKVKILKSIFEKNIDGKLLIDILENNILNSKENVTEISKIFNIDENSLYDSQVIYIICKLIAANYHVDNISMPANELNKLVKETNYKDELAKKVMEQLHIAPFNLQGLENTNIYLSEPYVSSMLIYANILVNSIANTKNKNLKNHLVSTNLIYESSKSVISVLVLFQLGAYSQAITVYRNLLEQMVKLEIIETHPEVLESYHKFCNYNIAYQNGKPNYEFEEEIKNKHIRKAWLQNYLMYGWLDEIEGYNHNYSFKSATELCEMGDMLYKLYEYASRFTHATHIGLDYNYEGLKYYFTINTLSIFKLIVEVYRNYTDNKDEIVNGINLYKLLISSGIQLEKVVNYLSIN